MLASLKGYVVATSTTDPRTVQSIKIPAGETGTIDITVTHEDGTPYDLTGSQLLFSLRGALISRQATIDVAASGTAHFPLVIADTVSLLGSYTYDVWLTDPSGNRYQVVLPSTFVITQAEGQPGQPVTVPATQQPLAQGPKGDTGTAPTYTATTTDGTTPVTLASYTMAASSALHIALSVLGRDSSGNVGRINLDAVFSSDGSSVVTRVSQDTSGAGPDSSGFPQTCIVDTNIVGSRVDVRVTGAAATTIAWQATDSQTTPAAPGTGAGSVGPQGPAGQAGLNWRGVYDGSATYQVNDAVQYTVGGATSSYRCIVISTGNAPTDAGHWSLIASGATATGATRSLRIMPIGDEHTLGVALTGGWRPRFQKWADDAFVPIDWVGSQTQTGTGLDDTDHEAHAGYLIANATTNIPPTTTGGGSWVAIAQPDVVVVLLGRNDVATFGGTQGGQMITDMTALINALLANLPDTGSQIVVCTLPPFSDVTKNAAITYFNSHIGAVVTAAGSRVHLCPLADVLTTDDLDTNGIDLIAEGDDKAAGAIWQTVNGLAAQTALLPSAGPTGATKYRHKRIMCAGDSNTDGTSGNLAGSYRIEMNARLTGDVQGFHWVGTLVSGDPAVVPDRYHEGHGGYTIMGAAGLYGVIEPALAEKQPDIVLLWIGTNDANQSLNPSGMPTRLGLLLDFMHSISPLAVIVCMTIPPINGAANANVTPYNAAMPSVASSRSFCRFLDVASVLTTADLQPDGLHLLPEGYGKVGDYIYNNLNGVL